MIKNGNAKISHQDKVHFSIGELQMGCRLACRTNVEDEMEIEITQADSSAWLE